MPEAISSIATLKDVIDLGLSGILALAVWQLWKENIRLNRTIETLLREFIERDDKSRSERHAIARAVNADEE